MYYWGSKPLIITLIEPVLHPFSETSYDIPVFTVDHVVNALR